MTDPKINLAIDNCFAYKRYTRPDDWARVISDLGVKCIEASADTELDPLFMGEEYLKDWVGLVREAEAKHGVKVVNLYSGHGTYTTLGLTHTDERVRRRMIDKWFKPLIKIAADVKAGLGFYAHAFDDFILQDRELYAEYVEILYCGLSELAEYAAQVGCGDIGLEQMYSPHQVPWRIEESKMLIAEVTRRSGRDFYLTEDVGHHHIKFMAPTREQIEKAYKKGDSYGLWLGTKSAYKAFDRGDIDAVIAEITANPHMYSQKRDGDCYEWLREIGKYSPIVHLQQTDGLSSAHKHFISAGKINGPDVLRAIAESYKRPDIPVKPCDEISLTIEAFTGTTAINHDMLADYGKSVEYWRQFIPKDGMKLSELIERL